MVRNGEIGVDIGVDRESGDVTSDGVDDSDELELRPAASNPLTSVVLRDETITNLPVKL